MSKGKMFGSRSAYTSCSTCIHKILTQLDETPHTYTREGKWKSLPLTFVTPQGDKKGIKQNKTNYTEWRND
jgi:hypothetical protein